MSEKRVSSGIQQLDQLLDGLFIGDNVLWYNDTGSLASVFCMNLVRESQARNKPIIYVSFDRSPKNLLTFLGSMAESQNLTILDCFTNGKGDGSEVFTKFYEKDGAQWPYPVIQVNTPRNPDMVAEAIYGLHQTMSGDVRFIIESLTGMQDLWGGEEAVAKFYSRSCPRLYELDTIAYWLIEKDAHSARLKAHINQIAQVAIDLSVKRGKTALTILKAENRKPETLNEPCQYFSEDIEVVFESDKHPLVRFDLGTRIKTVRKKQGISQKDLARMIGVTPSTISQVESNTIYPSLPALFRIAENLSVDVGSLFHSDARARKKVVFPGDAGIKVNFTDTPKGSILGEMLVSPDLDARAEPYLIRIPPKRKLSAHFFKHKGEEMGFVLEGALEVKIGGDLHVLKAGDTIYLKEDIPLWWNNTEDKTARMLWIQLK